MKKKGGQDDMAEKRSAEGEVVVAPSELAGVEANQGEDDTSTEAVAPSALAEEEGAPALVSQGSRDDQKLAATSTEHGPGQQSNPPPAAAAASMPGAFAVGAGGPAAATAPLPLEWAQQELHASKLAYATVNTNSVPEPAHMDAGASQQEEAKEQSNPPPSRQEGSIELAPMPPSGTNNSNIEESRERKAEVEEAPMVVAELIEPPVEAVQVIYDEGSPQLQMDLEEAGRRGQPQTSHSHTTTSIEDSQKRSKRRQIVRLSFALMLLLVIVLVLATTIPLATRGEDASEVEAAQDNSISYPFECYTTTEDLIQAQLDQPNTSRFILCPHTHITIGHLADVATNDTSIVEGDLPLMVLRDNVEIFCGLDGSVSNQCILEGGFAQVLLEPILPTRDKEHYLQSVDNDNVTIRGLTFTGVIDNDYTLAGASVVVSNRGQSITFVDCLWENMTALSGLIFVGNNLFQEITGLGLIEAHTAHVVFEDCSFRNIVYNQALLAAREQNLTLKQCRFEDIRLPELLSFSEDSLIGGMYCHGLVFCDGNSHCRLEDICIDGLEYAGLAAVMLASQYAKVTLAGGNSIQGVHRRSAAEEEKTCDSGFARFWEEIVEDGFNTVCTSQQTLDALWTPASICTLDLPAEEKGHH